MSDLGPLAAALAKAQTDFPTVTRDKKVTVQTKTGGSYSFNYAPLDSILNAVRGPLSANGLVVVQLLDEGALVTSLIHDSGAVLSGRVDLPNTPDIQALGSAVTYLRRYAIQAMLGIAAEDDDDGNRAAGNRIEPRRVSPLRDNRPVEQRTTHHDGLIGKAIAQGTQDFQLRQGPDGPVLPFRIKEGRLSQIAVARGPIAVALDTYRDEVLNQRCTVWGTYTDEKYPKKDKDGEPYDVTYKVLHVERIKTPAFEIPVPIGVMPDGTTMADPSYGEQDVMESDALEAESLPVWEPLDEEERALVAGNLPA